MAASQTVSGMAQANPSSAPIASQRSDQLSSYLVGSSLSRAMLRLADTFVGLI
jgi:hypothetical protein